MPLKLPVNECNRFFYSRSVSYLSLLLLLVQQSGWLEFSTLRMQSSCLDYKWLHTVTVLSHECTVIPWEVHRLLSDRFVLKSPFLKF